MARFRRKAFGPFFFDWAGGVPENGFLGVFLKTKKNKKIIGEKLFAPVLKKKKKAGGWEINFLLRGKKAGLKIAKITRLMFSQYPGPWVAGGGERGRNFCQGGFGGDTPNFTFFLNW